jgi:hypothetical protein
MMTWLQAPLGLTWHLLCSYDTQKDQLSADRQLASRQHAPVQWRAVSARRLKFHPQLQTPVLLRLSCASAAPSGLMHHYVVTAILTIATFISVNFTVLQG